MTNGISVVAALVIHLGFRWGSAFAASLFVLNDRDGRSYKLNAAVPTIGPGMQFAVVVEVILSVELVLTAKLARKTVGTFTVECLLVSFEMLVSPESLVATRVVALAHCSTNDVNGSTVAGCGPLSRRPNLGPL